MQFFKLLFDLFRHLGEDAKWRALIDYVGQPTLYVILFSIIFAETGLVILPFLPGDSLLFAIGALGARDTGVNLPLLTVLLIVAAILGDAVNYWIGYKVGPTIFSREESANATAPAREGQKPEYDGVPRKASLATRFMNKKHLIKAQEFYEKHGGKTIILARFVPIIRTFAPFVAGIGRMNYLRFAAYNVVGAIAWVTSCIVAGKLFGEIPFVKKNFELVIIAIVVISVIPVLIEFWKARNAEKRGQDAILEATTIGEKQD